MDFLKEIENYCKSNNHVGALMLSGEWGCGKTYFIEHDLKEALKEKFIIIRVSLFGINSTQELQRKIQEEGFNKLIEEKTSSAFSELVNKITDVGGKIKDTGILSEKIQPFLSIDLKNVFNLKTKIGNKKVVLVFDDLERCNNLLEIIGVINDYCENQKFITIVVSNENKIQTKKEKECQQKNCFLDYANIKEKIIERTIKYEPDYTKIIENIIRNLEEPDDSKYYMRYKEILKSNKACLLSLLYSEENEINTYNIRSLKCAINNFYRIFEILIKNGETHFKEWIYTFCAYTFYNKLGNSKKNDDSVYEDNDVYKVYALYPNIDGRYLLDGLRKWISEGIWNEEEIDKEIKQILLNKDGMKSWQKIAYFNIQSISSDTLQNGFEEYLQKIYSGELSLDAYIFLIRNSVMARGDGVDLPRKIEWGKVQKGIELQIEKTKEKLFKSDNPIEGYQVVNTGISEEMKQRCNKEELELYNEIEGFSNIENIRNLKNKEIYIEGMRNVTINHLYNISYIRFSFFDEDMAKVTFEVFKNLDNADKQRFIGTFKNCFSNITELIHKEEYTKTEKGFLNLKNELERIKIDKKKVGKRDYELVHIENFEKEIEEILEKIKINLI